MAVKMSQQSVILINMLHADSGFSLVRMHVKAMNPRDIDC